MILGVGVDLASIDRMARFLERWEDRAVRRCFTEGERAYCKARRHPEVHFAARFAAKEAAAKALGTGISRGVHWKAIEVVRRPGEPPRIVLHDAARRLARDLGVQNIHLSLGHEAGLAVAFVVLEGNPTETEARPR